MAENSQKAAAARKFRNALQFQHGWRGCAHLSAGNRKLFLTNTKLSLKVGTGRVESVCLSGVHLLHWILLRWKQGVHTTARPGAASAGRLPVNTSPLQVWGPPPSSPVSFRTQTVCVLWLHKGSAGGPGSGFWVSRPRGWQPCRGKGVLQVSKGYFMVTVLVHGWTNRAALSSSESRTELWKYWIIFWPLQQIQLPLFLNVGSFSDLRKAFRPWEQPWRMMAEIWRMCQSVSKKGHKVKCSRDLPDSFHQRLFRRTTMIHWRRFQMSNIQSLKGSCLTSGTRHQHWHKRVEMAEWPGRSLLVLR